MILPSGLEIPDDDWFKKQGEALQELNKQTAISNQQNYVTPNAAIGSPQMTTTGRGILPKPEPTLRERCLSYASTLQNNSLDEMIANAEKLERYLQGN